MTLPYAHSADDLATWDEDSAYDWMQEAACIAADPDLFFDQSTDEAKAICGMCPVRARCLAYAIAEGISYGVFGGMTEAERRRLSA